MACTLLQESIENLTTHKTSDYEKIFFDSAHKIMNDYNLVINSSIFELVELEYYFNDCNDKKMHDDPYVHCDELQRTTCNQFYVHKKACTRTGIDITFGNGNYFGGILIRGVKLGNEYINGTATIAQKIAEKAKITCIPTNTKCYDLLQNYFDTYPTIGLTPKTPITEENVLRCFREGLNLKVCDYFKKEDKYLSRLYRFIREDAMKGTIKQKEKVIKLNEMLLKKQISSDCC